MVTSVILDSFALLLLVVKGVVSVFSMRRLKAMVVSDVEREPESTSSS